MPQLVKRGKYVFGWSVVGEDCGIRVSEEARKEYRLEPGEPVVIIFGSRTSGGFSIAREFVWNKSKLASALPDPSMAPGRGEQGIIESRGRQFYRTVMLHAGRIVLPLPVLALFGVKPGNRLLAVRGSYLGLGMAAKGPLVAEAEKHPELEVFS